MNERLLILSTLCHGFGPVKMNLSLIHSEQTIDKHAGCVLVTYYVEFEFQNFQSGSNDDGIYQTQSGLLGLYFNVKVKFDLLF